ncbi:MAG TPA: 50S ribosomal protein L3 [Chthoniobacterales bacterium]|jgi:large subunit ribosomal protein L3|nr:50S ribosomal protein L3 [Chthoniobacterales bacterium]
MSIGLLGQKIGMTSVYDANGRLHPVTVIATGDNVLLRRLTEENDGYFAVQVGFGVQNESRVSKAELGNFKKAGVEPQRFVREFRLRADLPEGDVNLSVTQFQPGDFVDVIGRSKGKGFQGVMKKHNFHGQGAAHGSKTHRRNGAIGNRSTPGRIWKNMGMPGHLGDERVTVQNLRVMQVREAEKIILVSGAVPGCNGSYVVVRPAIKDPAAQLALHQQHAKADAAVHAKKPKKAGELAEEKKAQAKEAARK